MAEKDGLRTKDEQQDGLYSEKAYIFLKRMILEMKIPSKEPLSESKLATLIGMSRTPVREALKRLKNENIVISSDKKGYFLNIPTVKEIKDLYELRAILEGAAVKLATQRIDPGELEKFEEKFLLYKNGLNNGGTTENGFVNLGRKFHFFIIESAKNEKLKELLMGIYEQLEISRVYSYDRRRKEAVDEHLKIVSALKERDEARGQAAMQEHLENAFQMLIKIL
jgi:DNA-binding GntR family transcriptional regulator